MRSLRRARADHASCQPFFWDKTPIIDASAPSVWSELASAAPVDLTGLEDDFAFSSASETPASTPKAHMQKSKTTSLLLPQRGQNVEIVLKRMRMPAEAIRAAVLAVDEKLSIDTLKALKQQAPTSDEVRCFHQLVLVALTSGRAD